jgi:type IX secretion system PorP/SprF family membrane protein
MKNLKIQLTTIVFLILGLNGFAQQDPMYTQYSSNPLLVNPAFAGSMDFGHMAGIFRKQWVGINGSPTTSSISYNAPIKKYNFGVGASLMYDALGPTTQTGLFLDYSYHIRFDQKGTLSLGLKGGFSYYYINYRGLTYNDPDDDINLLENQSLFLPNFGLGAYYYTDKSYIGLSVPKLIRNSLNKNENTLEHLNREEWHVFLMAGHIFRLSDNINFKPSFITRYAVGSPLSVELNGTIMLYDKVWLGLMYRVGDTMGGLVRWQINDKLNIGYSYDLSNSALKVFNRGTHEITIGFSFIKNNQNIMLPRYF